ncbi:MAG: hypothetical protein AAGB24_02645 [Bacteroidota bacterium]
MTKSLLARHEKFFFHKEPFPHLCIVDALENSLYQKLVWEFPSDTDIIKDHIDTGNSRFHLHGHEILEKTKNKALSDFVNYHCSPLFLKEFLTAFKPSIQEYYPEAKKWINESHLNTGIQFQDDIENKDVVLNCMACINSIPKDRVKSVRSAHIDLPDKLYTGLFYLKDPNDDGEGGDLNLYSFKKGLDHSYRSRKENDLLGMGEIPLELLHLEKTIRYSSNMFVIFLNTPHSIHGVTPRKNAAHSRRFFCVTAKFNHDMFRLSTFQKTS